MEEIVNGIFADYTEDTKVTGKRESIQRTTVYVRFRGCIGEVHLEDGEWPEDGIEWNDVPVEWESIESEVQDWIFEKI